MEKTVVEEYKSSLKDLNFNSKPLINMLTMLADENKKHAPLIVKTIVDHIKSVPPESKLLGLYLVDSIIKNLGAEYMRIFCQQISSLFTSVFEKVDENTRSSMFKLRQTWTDIIPNKILYYLDVDVKKLDPAWPITAQEPAKKILINPKLLDGSLNEKKSSDTPVASLKAEKDKIKQKQGEVLKQLLAKQEQLKLLENKRQLELKKFQLTMKKKTAAVGPIVPASNSFKQSVLCDPRMAKFNKICVNVSPSKVSTTPTAEQKFISKSEINSADSDITNSKKPFTPIRNLQCSSSNSVIANLQSASSKSANVNVQLGTSNSTKANVQPSNFNLSKEHASNANSVKTNINVASSNTTKANVQSSNSVYKRNIQPNNTKYAKTNVQANSVDSGSNEKPFKPGIKINDQDRYNRTWTRLRNKRDKYVAPKNGQTEISKGTPDQEVKCSSLGDVTKISKSDEHSHTNESSFFKANEGSPTNCFKGTKASTKKKYFEKSVSNSNLNAPTESLRKKISRLKIPKKSDRKFPLKSDSLNNSENKIVPNIENESTLTSSNIEHPEIKEKNMLLDNTVNKPKTVKTSDSESDINVMYIRPKDEDLRVNSQALYQESQSERMLKRENDCSNLSPSEVDKLNPPRKKIKSEDIENHNPEIRNKSPVLFGNEDQDLRHSSMNDPNLKDWSQYKATHPDEYSPVPGTPEDYHGRFRFRRQRFSDFRHGYPPEHDRYSSNRYFRGRYGSRRFPRRMYFPRGMRGRWVYNNPVASVMLDSHAFLQQAEEKFLAGRISESEYFDLRRDLQRIAASSEYHLLQHHMPRRMNFEHYERMLSQSISSQQYEQERIPAFENRPSQRYEPETIYGSDTKPSQKYEPERIASMSNIQPQKYKHIQIPVTEKSSLPPPPPEYKPERNPAKLSIPPETFRKLQENYQTENLKMQTPSGNPPRTKTFILDDEEKVIYFIDDIAVIHLPNKEPRELTFKDEPRNIYIEGTPKPIMMCFNGKSVEFEADGRRHIMRLGIPGREIYINNHPYEAQFGGPCLAVRLEDGCIYKIYLSGPAPQVLIGDKPLHELFAKFHGELLNAPIKHETDHAKGLDAQTQSTVAISQSVIPISLSAVPPISQCVVSTSEPTVSTSELAVSTSEPTVSTSEPTVSTSEPTVSTSEPTVSTSEPTVSTSEPTVSTSEPTVSTSEPTVSISESTVSTSEHRVSTSEHTVPTSEHTVPPSQCATLSSQSVVPTSTCLQDIDMRVTFENVPQTDMLMNKVSPFFTEGMKDVDWRCLPPSKAPQVTPEQLKETINDPSNIVESNKGPTGTFCEPVAARTETWNKKFSKGNACFEESQDRTSTKIETWVKEDKRSSLPEDRLDQPKMFVKKDPLNYNEWDHHAPMHRGENRLSNQEMWYPKQENADWQNVDYRRNVPPHTHESNVCQIPTNTMQQRPSCVSFAQKTSFEPRTFVAGHQYRSFHWHEGTRPPAHYVPRPRFSSRALLPPPPFPPFITIGHPAQLAESLSKASTAVQNEPIHAGPSTSEIQLTESASQESAVDVESLLQKLIATGIINSKPYEEPDVSLPEISAPESKEEKEKPKQTVLDEIPNVELSSESLKLHRSSVITALHKGQQCATCGMRFKELQGEQYSQHLDWHFRMNRREKDGSKKPISRRWYYEIEDWLQFEEFEDFEERVPSYFELQTEDAQAEEEEAPVVISVPATNDDQESCPVCCERFQLFWVEEEEEWHYRNAVRHDAITYHPACYEDYKKACEEEKSHEEEMNQLTCSENMSPNSSDIAETIIDVLNVLLERVCKGIEEMSLRDVSSISDISSVHNSAETVQELPSAEVHSEEEVLEGKPGEEEIIGLIAESEMEVDTNDIPKTESKMVVMQSGGITLKVKAESLQCHSPSNTPEKEVKVEGEKIKKVGDDDEEIEFRPPTPDSNFEVQPPVSRGRELSGLCIIM